jgi:hypothetical protein
MNQRNVEALTALILAHFEEDMLKAPRAAQLYGEAFRKGTPDIARYLAAHGVLVPSALTDEEIGRAISEVTDEWDEFRKQWPTVRAELERIAKGEAEPEE